ncbi:MAG TPA: TonB-dependent receptor [Pseudosphingobacterium sp.]|nr:TonB-dependent receptor [Pseudosphingobacterium sp.]
MTKKLWMLSGLLFFSFFSSFAQTKSISGKIVNTAKEPLPGVTVAVKGTTTTTSTNDVGVFNLNISNARNQVLVITYLGYKSQELPIGEQQNLNITLEEDAQGLDEVVVIGYGTMKKGDLTGAIGSVTSETLKARGTTSAMAALQGSVPGVDISSNSTKPGGGFNIQIRGQNSLAGGSPLYVVDGVVMGDINFLNPADIEQIDVLKDASSTAIYGSRGSNGVVIVRTKNAGSNHGSRMNVSYDGFYGIRKIARLPNFMSGREWVDFRTSAYYTYNTNLGRYELTPANRNSVLQRSPLLEQRLFDEDYEDWLALGTQDGHQQNHYVNLGGSSNDLAYNLGLGYQNEQGNFVNEGLKRYNMKLSIDHRGSKYFSAGGTINLSHTVTNQGSQYGYRDIMRMPVILKAYDDNGNLIDQPGVQSSIQGTGNFTSSPNPLREINSGNEETRRYDVLASVYAQVNPFEGLSIKSTFMPRFTRERTGRYYGVVLGQRNQDEAFQQNDEDLEYTWDNQITYNKTFNNDHHLNATLINSFYKTRFERIQVGVQNLPYNSEWYNIFTGGTLDKNNSLSAYNESGLISYAARVNYDYKGKYLVTGTIRYDGSSKLADKWASFPSFALGWRLSEEEFMKADWLSDLKARFSFGYSGNNNGISPYGSMQTPIANELIWYDFGDGNAVSGLRPGYPVNPIITWEKTRELNFGLDFGFFNQRLYGSVDIYDKLSDGLLMSRSLAIESGVASMTDNIGSVSNQGIEIALNSTNIRTPNFQWTTSLNFAHNKNAIESLYGKKEDVMGQKRFIGQPIEVIYDYRVVGVWRSDEVEEAARWGQQPGQARVEDINGDGIITAANDRVILGSPNPKWTANFRSTFNYKNWDLSVDVFTRQGMFVQDRFLEEFGPGNTQRGRPKIRFDYFVPQGIDRYDWSNWGTKEDGSPSATWSPASGNENGKYPAINNAGPYYGNNGQYTDASFVKIRNIILGYTLPSTMLSKAKISQLRVYLNILNPFTFTKYEGWDPEYATTSLQNGNGPSTVTYQLGVNLKF